MTKSAISFLYYLFGISAFLFVFIPANIVSAHPHVWVDCHLVYEFDDQGLKGLRQEWFFDEMFTVSILDMVDTNRDFTLSPEEVLLTEKDAFSNLKNFNFFTTFYVDDKELKSFGVSEFTARVDQGKLVYSFFIPLEVPAKDQIRVIKAIIFDETNYTDIVLKSGKTENQGPHLVHDSMEKGTEVESMYGVFSPQGYKVEFASP